MVVVGALSYMGIVCGGCSHGELAEPGFLDGSGRLGSTGLRSERSGRNAACDESSCGDLSVRNKCK